jgi:hypothetical protein
MTRELTEEELSHAHTVKDNWQAEAELRAEIERLKADNERTHALVRDVSTTRDTAVNMHLKDTAEVEQLKALLRRHYLRGAWWDNDLAVETRTALEDKPCSQPCL